MRTIGIVSNAERDIIESIHERRNSLYELSKIITDPNDELYNRLMADIDDIDKKFQNWWNDMKLKYKWETAPTSEMEINFNTCEIYIINED